MSEFQLLIDLHREGARQGPGGDDETRFAIALSGLGDARDLRVADIGCGTGASTMVLARELDAHVTAVDMIPEFLQTLDDVADHEGLSDRVTTQAASMESPPFEDGSLDAIWSEGAIYAMGFERGIRTWRRFLKPNGILAVSELTWFTRRRPKSLERHWRREYPEVDTASAKMTVLEDSGYAPLGYFTLPDRCWMENYYQPLLARFDAFLARNGHSKAARAVVETEMTEISLYESHSAYFGYGFYLARKTPDEAEPGL